MTSVHAHMIFVLTQQVFYALSALFYCSLCNESTTGADASVEMPKLLSYSFYTHIDYNYHD